MFCCLMFSYIVLRDVVCCGVLCCIVLLLVVLCYIALCCAMFCYAVLCCIMLCYAVYVISGRSHSKQMRFIKPESIKLCIYGDGRIVSVSVCARVCVFVCACEHARSGCVYVCVCARVRMRVCLMLSDGASAPAASPPW